ncbi:cryptochrome/photolyase family protein [Fodinicurvata fenggangensis]|uniref:cryptochrome/photolyase family protein n=1 Tax=Fodinicurvata fenggangensis TaxID=1121830 RepID=UPI00047E318E|nr:deoxyribodipyrimidine photo-lyase [Fodinicurvata fenggangensis]
MSENAPTIVWFRQDLRLADNPALRHAVQRGGPVVALFILEDSDAGACAPGGASRWWLHSSLAALAHDLRTCGSELILRRGPAQKVLSEIVQASGARAVYWNRCYEPWRIARDSRIKQGLQDQGLDAESFNAALLFEPWTVATGSGTPFKVFTPFWKAVRERPVDRPEPAPPQLPPASGLASDRLEDWGLCPTRPDWAGGLRETWQPGEAGARARLVDFLDHGLGDYGTLRDYPARAATSRLSPHLHWGEIGPRQVWHATQHRIEQEDLSTAGWKFLSEMGWREFCHHLLYHWPSLPDENWRTAFDAFPWSTSEDHLKAWQAGQTGYPIVDAGMRELWHTGWMHNRLRMIVGSFLVKDLHLHWKAGEAWFWDTLVDADLANNAAGWQWIAGSGADAAPFFRIFNPVTQSEKFDPKGEYLRTWLPEIAALPDPYIHRPWHAPEEVRRQAGVVLGGNYPCPLVDHAQARRAALEAFQTIKKDQ